MDYLHLQNVNHRVAVDVDIATGDTAKGNVVTVKDSKHSIFIQKITLAITTHSDGKTVTFQDDAGTAVPIAAHTDATAAAGVPSVVVFDFGVVGTKLTEGKNLDIALSAAGIAGRVHIEGYQKLTAVTHL